MCDIELRIKYAENYRVNDAILVDFLLEPGGRIDIIYIIAAFETALILESDKTLNHMTKDRGFYLFKKKLVSQNMHFVKTINELDWEDYAHA
jgi:hypothetical protein